jgi:dienelactone hydrolase
VTAPRDVTVTTRQADLPGLLAVPDSPAGAVVFAHGTGSSRLSPRNQAVAATLNQSGFATLLFDLLTPAEAADRSNVFDIALLAQRLAEATAWLREYYLPDTAVGLFGASTGAAAALVAETALPSYVQAIVSRGGRPDLAGDHLPEVRSPTLLIVGGRDDVVLELNRQAMAQMKCPVELSIVEGATHLFEEPGALEEAAARARDWFARHLAED